MSLSPLSSHLGPLSSNLINLFDKEPVKTGTVNVRETFSNLLQEALQTAEQTDIADKTSAVELVTGTTDDLSGLLLDAEKAEIALRLALQLRNKVIDAYNEIMRMQV